MFFKKLSTAFENLVDRVRLQHMGFDRYSELVALQTLQGNPKRHCQLQALGRAGLLQSPVALTIYTAHRALAESQLPFKSMRLHQAVRDAIPALHVELTPSQSIDLQLIPNNCHGAIRPPNFHSSYYSVTIYNQSQPSATHRAPSYKTLIALLATLKTEIGPKI